ncbi:MAG: SRPBCC family protein, partial [Solirubrobacterales bacterium]
MGPVSLSIPVDASREQVFDLLVDLSARPAWIDHFASDYRLERLPSVGEGAAARFRVDAPGGIRYMETVIADAERPHLVVEHGRGGHLDRVPLRAVWELAEGAGVTTVSLTFWSEPAALFDKLRELGRSRWWRRRWAKALRRMRELIESGADAAP